MESTPALTDRGSGDIDDFHAFRERKYNFLYLCGKCARSFDSVLSMSECKFCSSPVTELSARQNHPLIGEAYFRYYCPKCEKNFLSRVKHDECQMCGFRMINFYRWEDMPLKDKIMVKLFKSVSAKEPKPETNAPAEPKPVVNAKLKPLAVPAIPDFSFVVKKLKTIVPKKQPAPGLSTCKPAITTQRAAET